MKNIPLWLWAIIILVAIGFVPGVWHEFLSLLENGMQTVCNNCTTGHG